MSCFRRLLSALASTRLPAIGLLACLGLSPDAVAEAEANRLRVVVTVAPVHALAAAVMEGAGEPDLLITGALSEHTYALKPSDARKLNAAQIVVRVAANLETFLNKPLEALPHGAALMTLAGQPGVILWPLRAGGDFEGHSHDEDDHDHAGHEEGAGASADPHIWLDPQNAIAIADRLARAFSTADASRAALYASNAEALKARLRRLDDELRADLAPVRGRPYIVFHDAWQYFEKRYGLSPAGSISLSSAQPPGAAHLLALRHKIQRLGAVCVFAEPQFDARLARSLTEGTGAKNGVLDGLGASLTPGSPLYFDLMRGLARDLKACVAPDAGAHRQ